MKRPKKWLKRKESTLNKRKLSKLSILSATVCVKSALVSGRVAASRPNQGGSGHAPIISTSAGSGGVTFLGSISCWLALLEISIQPK